MEFGLAIQTAFSFNALGGTASDTILPKQNHSSLRQAQQDDSYFENYKNRYKPTGVGQAIQREEKRNLFTLTKLDFTAYITMEAVFFTPSFCIIFLRWVFTVCGLKKSRSAITVFVIPSAIKVIISCSRADRLIGSQVNDSMSSAFGSISIE